MSGLFKVHRIALHLPVAHRNSCNPCRSSRPCCTINPNPSISPGGVDMRTKPGWKTSTQHVSQGDELTEIELGSQLKPFHQL